MTERPYETTVPDDLTFGTTSPTAASGDYTAGSTSQSQGTAGGKVSGVADQATSEAKSVASDAKDSGHLFGAHGGALDRLDAVTFTVVAGYYVWLAML